MVTTGHHKYYQRSSHFRIRHHHHHHFVTGEYRNCKSRCTLWILLLSWALHARLMHFLFAVHFFLEAVSPGSLFYPNFVPRSHILPNSSQKLILPFHFFSSTLRTLYHVLWSPAAWCANFRPTRQASRGLRSAFIKLHNKVSLLVFLPFSLQFSPLLFISPSFSGPLEFLLQYVEAQMPTVCTHAENPRIFHRKEHGSIIIK